MDHYKVLQVDPGAEPEVIEKAYKALCLKYHPDVVAPEMRAHATERMKRINRAHAVLRDRRSRREYDRTLPCSQTPTAWDQFLEKGLLGMLLDKVTSGDR